MLKPLEDLLLADTTLHHIRHIPARANQSINRLGIPSRLRLASTIPNLELVAIPHHLWRTFPESVQKRFSQALPISQPGVPMLGEEHLLEIQARTSHHRRVPIQSVGGPLSGGRLHTYAHLLSPNGYKKLRQLMVA